MPHASDHHASSQKFFSIATWGLGFVVLVTVFLVVVKQFYTVEVRETPTIQRLMGQWKSAGLPVGEISPAADPYGAAEAGEADIDGMPVIVYQFDPLDAAQLKTLDKIKAEGSIMHDGRKTPAMVNGPFVLAGYEGHPDKDVIVQTFQGFGTFEGIKAEQKLDMPPKN